MSLKIQAIAFENQAAISVIEERLDKLEKNVILLLKSVSAVERQNRTTDTGVTVPQVKLPDSLAELEIGKNPKGA